MRPHIFLLQVTWLDGSVESVTIADYRIISRKDRKDTTNRGGILSLVRNEFNRLVFIGDSVTEERSWHFLHADPEVLLVGNWYQPGATIHDGYAALQEEIAEHSSDATGIILNGDLNIHHAKMAPIF